MVHCQETLKVYEIEKFLKLTMLKGFLQHHCTSFQINTWPCSLVSSTGWTGVQTSVITRQVWHLHCCKTTFKPKELQESAQDWCLTADQLFFGKTPLPSSNVSFSKCHNQRKINFLSAMSKVRFKTHKCWAKAAVPFFSRMLLCFLFHKPA